MYVLKDGVPIECGDVVEWSRWMQQSGEREVGVARLPHLDGGVIVSTVFLGINHNYHGLFDGNGVPEEPVLWETMIFGGPHNEWTRRYTSLEEAQVGHALAVQHAEFGRTEYETSED